MDIRTVTVVGATGTMGANVAGIFASFGDARVYCVGRDVEKIKRTIPRIVRSVRADSIAHNLIPAGIDVLEECVADSDLVFESCAEDMEVKRQVATRVGSAMRAHAVSCTGTSGLSVTEISSCYPEGACGRFLGAHLFNPPYAMPLCELIATEHTDSAVREGLRGYLSDVLHRTVVDVKDTPAFLANRIGFQFINEALRHAGRYADSGGIDYIDAILGPFTGRSMAPLATADFVGLDIHRAIVDNLHENTNDYAHDSFALPGFAKGLIGRGMLGRKSGGGLYRLVRHDDGRRQRLVYDIASGEYRDAIPYEFPFARRIREVLADGDYADAMRALVDNRSQEAEVCLSFLLSYVIYALWAQREVGYGDHAADDVMATGFNWCPPQAMLAALSLVADVPALVRERIPEVCERVDAEGLLSSAVPSRYDYRPYFKARG